MPRGRYALCWVYHVQREDKITVYPWCKVESLPSLVNMVRSAGLEVTPRRGKLIGFASLYPLPIVIRTAVDLERLQPIILFCHALHESASAAGRSASVSKTEFTTAIEVPSEDSFPEGAVARVSVNVYERNGRARSACLKHYGFACTVCAFDFEKQFGPLGRGFIHVHHVIQLSEIKRSYKVDPIRDLRPVCPNCHEMLHRSHPTLSVEHLKEILLGRKEGRDREQMLENTA